MQDESRSARALRAVNEEIKNDAAAIKGMDPSEKRAMVAGVILAAVIVGLLALYAAW